MRFRCKRSPRVAVAAICGCSLVSLCVFQFDVWHFCATHGRSMSEQFVDRYAPLAPLSPTEEELRFVVDKQNADPEVIHPVARIGLAQYALSPRRVARDAVSRWVIVDSDRPDIVPEIAASGHWTLVADLRNGGRLYRTDLRR